MFQKLKSFFTSAHCEEWDNEMQNQGRAQALFACLSQALSEEEMSSPGKWLSHFWGSLCKGPDLGLCRSCCPPPWWEQDQTRDISASLTVHFCGVLHFSQQNSCAEYSICVTAENQRDERDLWPLVINKLNTPRSLTIEDLTRTVHLVCQVVLLLFRLKISAVTDFWHLIQIPLRFFIAIRQGWSANFMWRHWNQYRLEAFLLNSSHLNWKFSDF